MKIAHLADLHIGGTGGKAGMPLAEQRELLLRMVADVKEQGCEAALVAGDIFHSSTTTDDERELAEETLSGLPPSVVIPGNETHDSKKDLRMVCKASGQGFIGRPETYGLFGLTVCCLPWPSRKRLAAWGDDSASIDGKMTECLKRIITGFSALPSPRILLSHLDVFGAKWDGGQEAVGQPVSVTVQDLIEANFDYVALGHYHRMQKLADRIWYGGATHQIKFGDDEHKGYLIYDTETREVEVREIKSRRLLTVDLGLGKIGGVEPESWFNGGVSVQKGDIVRMRYEVTEDLREDARRQAERVARETFGEARVIIEPKITAVAQVRSEAMTKAKTLGEKLDALWETDGRPKRAEQIKAKLEAIA